MDQANDSKAHRVVRNTDDGESCPLDVAPLERFLVRCVTRDGVKTLLFERLQVERAAVDHAYFLAGRFQVRCNTTAEWSDADDKRVTRRHCARRPATFRIVFGGDDLCGVLQSLMQQQR